MDPLNYEGLNTQEKLYLGSLSKHPGYVVLRKLMDDACRQATELVIKLNPEDPQYDAKLKARQIVARTTNDVCATLIKSIVMHTEAGVVEEQISKSEEALEEVHASLGAQFGSVTIKSREGRQ